MGIINKGVVQNVWELNKIAAKCLKNCCKKKKSIYCKSVFIL